MSTLDDRPLAERIAPSLPRPRDERDAVDRAYDDLYNTAEFAELRRRFRRLVIPLVAGFVGWYAAYVLIATYDRSFMAHNLIGNINVGLVAGLLQFASTFAIAWFYAARAERDVDPLSTELRRRFDEQIEVAE